MFSFRTTPIEEQPDKSLVYGRVGCFCSQSSFNPDTGLYVHEIFRRRGNLVRLFAPKEPEMLPRTNHIEFSQADLEGLDAVVVEIQDVGVRYFNFTRDVMHLLSMRARMEDGPAIYIVDHPNPLGRVVEGTMPAVESDIWTPKVAHRHGLTLAELSNLYYSEIDAKFPLHIISAQCRGTDCMSIAPSSDLAGPYSCAMYSGGGLWNNTAITPGIGTARPYEYIGAPWIMPEEMALPPHPDEVVMRPCEFSPSDGQYRGELCRGYQIMLKSGAQYHSLLHTLEMMRYFAERYSMFEMTERLFVKVADPVIEEYLKGGITFDIVQEHVKIEEQKWIRKAKRYVLYDELPYRIK